MNHLSEMLPGTWVIKGTTFPMWTSGNRRDPSITYEKIQTEPLELSDVVSYTRKNKVKEIKGIDRFKDGRFIWRGAGILKLLKSQWEVLYIGDEILIIQFQSSMVTPSGLDILVRKNSTSLDVKSYVEDHFTDLNLSEEMLRDIEWI